MEHLGICVSACVFLGTTMSVLYSGGSFGQHQHSTACMCGIFRHACLVAAERRAADRSVAEKLQVREGDGRKVWYQADSCSCCSQN